MLGKTRWALKNVSWGMRENQRGIIDITGTHRVQLGGVLKER